MSRFYRAAGVLAVLALPALGTHLDATAAPSPHSFAEGHRLPGAAPVR